MDRRVIWEGDTPGGHHQVVDTLYDGRHARVLYSGNRQAAQAGVATDTNPDLLFDYNQRLFELLTTLVPKRLLLIGGSVCTLPAALLAVLADTTIDVVEPDTGLQQLAQDYFGLKPDPRLRVFHTDGLQFLQTNQTQYDCIVIDAFVHTTIPLELTTPEAVRLYYAHLAKNGLVAMNVISSYMGRGSDILHGLHTGFSREFDQVDMFLAGRGYSLWLPQNFVLTAQKGEVLPLQDYMRYDALKPLAG
jgi:spermidine synthase